MYKKNFGAYAETGLLAGLIIAVLATLMYYILGLFFGYETAAIGTEQDRLYAVFVAFASFLSTLIGSFLFYFFQKTSRPVTYLSIAIAAGFLLNTFTAETGLADAYVWPAHLLHVFVAVLAIILIPRLSKARP